MNAATEVIVSKSIHDKNKKAVVNPFNFVTVIFQFCNGILELPKRFLPRFITVFQ